MTFNPELVNAVQDFFRQKGGAAAELARRNISQTFKDDSRVSKALRYFAEVTLSHALPVFPALVSASCEAAGGNTDVAKPFGEAIVLITGAADLHDDVIDKSLTKGHRRTVFGEFGEAITVLAGDVMLMQGLAQLQSAAESLSNEQRIEIVNLVARAGLEISCSQGLEIELRRQLTLPPDQYRQIINHKASVPELTTKMGAILANADHATTKAFAEFGRTYGVLSLVLDEFMDVLDFQELRHRLRYECPPLPFLCAIQNPKVQERILPLLKDRRLMKKDHEEIAKTVFCASEVDELKTEITSLSLARIRKLKLVANSETAQRMEMLLSVPLKCLQATGFT